MTGWTDATVGEPTGRDGPHVLVTDVEHPDVAAGDRHHLERVLRLRTGDVLTVGDGVGHWRVCRFGAVVEPAGPIVSVPRPDPALTVGFALVKGSRPELIVQKLTELGIDRIALVVAERSVVRWDEARADRNLERLTRVAREAVMQCRRSWLPEVLPVVPLAELVESHRSGPAEVVLADPGGGGLTAADQTVVVGPEGGWSEEERALVTRTVRLSDHVLRSETAAIATATLLVDRRRH